MTMRLRSQRRRTRQWLWATAPWLGPPAARPGDQSLRAAHGFAAPGFSAFSLGAAAHQEAGDGVWVARTHRPQSRH